MFATRDQENAAHAHRQATLQKQQNQAKPLGARHPKTPMRIPLDDENRTVGQGGKGLIGKPPRALDENAKTIGPKPFGGNKTTLVTPGPTQTARAPLGNKTTNAKTRPTQPAPVKDIVAKIEKTQARPTSNRRARPPTVKLESTRLAVHADQTQLLQQQEGNEEDIEYCPPPVPEIPYVSDVFSEGCIDLDLLTPENRFKGHYEYYYNDRDESGLTRLEREMQKSQDERLRKADEQTKKDLEEITWPIEDESPRKKPAMKQHDHAPARLPLQKRTGAITRPGSTLSAHSAATALSQPTILRQPTRSTVKPEPIVKKPAVPLFGRRAPDLRLASSKPSREAAAALVASRSTLGYNRGRAVSTSVTVSKVPVTNRRPLERSTSARSGDIAAAKVPRMAPPSKDQDETREDALESPERKLPFLSIFDQEDDNDDFVCGSSDIVDGDSGAYFEL